MEVTAVWENIIRNPSELLDDIFPTNIKGQTLFMFINRLAKEWRMPASSAFFMFGWTMHEYLMNKSTPDNDDNEV